MIGKKSQETGSRGIRRGFPQVVSPSLTLNAVLGVSYDGYEESGDGKEGNSEGISTSGVPFIDVSRQKLDDDGWGW